ncbi:MAG: Maf family protein, partial [Myxococcota bacterium]
HPLLLASGSPRRREMLARVGLPLIVRPVDVDECVGPEETPPDYLRRIAAAKYEAAVEMARGQRCGAWLVADTVVSLDGAIEDKPDGVEQARATLRRLSGRTHRVTTRFILGWGDRGEHDAESVTTEVRFADLDGATIEAYLRTQEGVDKAGAYGIQGIGAMLVKSVIGSYSNVVGLPLVEVISALTRHRLLPTSLPWG